MAHRYNNRCPKATTFLVAQHNNKNRRFKRMGTLADRLKLAMKAAGLTGSELARLASKTGQPVTQQNIQQLTSGRNKYSKHVPAIARALEESGVRFEWLVDGYGQMLMDTEVPGGTVSDTPEGVVSSKPERYMAEIAELDISPEAGAGANGAPRG